MSEQVVLTFIGVLIAALFALIGFVINAIWTKLTALEKDAGELSSFIARFDSTERAWESWRDEFLVDHMRRRDEINKRLDSHSAEIKQNGNRLTRLERNGG